MITAMARHIDACPEAKRYYDKKRAEGKKHNQALRCLARHMVRVIWSMLRDNREYKVREEISTISFVLGEQEEVNKIKTPPEVVEAKRVV